MAHTISVNLPNMPIGATVATPWGAVSNGSSLSLSDEQVAVWNVNNPGQVIPTTIDHSAADAQREAAIMELPSDAQQDLRDALDAQKQLDFADYKPTASTFVVPQNPAPLEGED